MVSFNITAFKAISIYISNENDLTDTLLKYVCHSKTGNFAHFSVKMGKKFKIGVRNMYETKDILNLSPLGDVEMLKPCYKTQLCDLNNFFTPMSESCNWDLEVCPNYSFLPIHDLAQLKMHKH